MICMCVPVCICMCTYIAIQTVINRSMSFSGSTQARKSRWGLLGRTETTKNMEFICLGLIIFKERNF